MSNSIYLLTGAAGFLGNNIARQLLERGCAVRGLVLANDPATKALPSGTEIAYGDLTDQRSLEQFFDVSGYSDVYVIHCASLISMQEEPSQKVYDVNVKGTEYILQLCVQKGVRKLVYVSSAGALCETPHGTAIREPAALEELNPNDVRGCYNKTKAMATRYVLEFATRHNLDTSVVYPTGICGPYDYAFGPMASTFVKYCAGEVPVGIQGSYNSVDVRDLASGIINCVAMGKTGEGYIMGNAVVTMKELFDLISQYSGAPYVTAYLTADQMIGSMKERLGSAGTNDRMISQLTFVLDNLTRNNVFDDSKARRELAYTTRAFAETVADEIAWLKEIGKISAADG